MVKNLTMPWWMYVLPLPRTLRFAWKKRRLGSILVLSQSHLSKPSMYVYFTLFAYVVEPEKQLLLLKVLKTSKTFLRYEKDIQQNFKIYWIDSTQCNLLGVCYADDLWFMVDNIENKQYDGAVNHGFITFFNFLRLTFLLRRASYVCDVCFQFGYSVLRRRYC